jgi:outer membrane receptor for ferrienterochelin and colicins
MNEIVVTANRHETMRRDAPSLVNVLEMKTFKNTHSVCLADGLSFQPGVRVEDNCRNCGYTQACLNGLDGRYTQLLLDSRPVFSAVSALYGLELVPVNMIERVEIIHGGGSALYGSSAIGGVVNIITKEPKKNEAEVGHSFQAIDGSKAFDNTTSLNATVVDADGRAGISVFGNIRHRSGYDREGDGFTELPLMRSETVGARSFLRIADRQRLTLQYNHSHDYHRGGNALQLPVNLSAVSEMSDQRLNGGAAEYKVWSQSEERYANVYCAIMAINRNSYSGGVGENPDAAALEQATKPFGHTNDFVCTTGTQVCQHFAKLWFMPSELTLGVEYQQERLKDEYASYDLLTKQNVHVYSGLFQNEWKDSQWSILIGGRLDKHTLLDHLVFSPRVNVRFLPFGGFVARLSYAGGFRAPQIYDEDLHVSQANGQRWKVYLHDDLKEERSHSVNASIDWIRIFGSWRTEATVEGFYNRLNNSFVNDYTQTIDDNGFYEIVKYNSGGVNVYGVNLELKAAWHKLLDCEGGITLQKSRYTTAERWSETAPAERRVLRTPDVYGYLDLAFTPWKDWAFSANGVYTGSMLIPHVAGSGTDVDVAAHTPSFFDLGLQVTYTFRCVGKTEIEVSGGVRNLFDAYQKDLDQGARRDADYVYGPMYPRGYYLTAKIRI